MQLPKRSTARGFLAGLLLLACTGPGSDIGPVIEPLPAASYVVLVRNEQDEGVTSASFSMQGSTATAATIRSGRADLAAVPAGTAVLSLTTEYASASDGDLLAGLSFQIPIVDPDEVPFVVYLPDQASSAGLPLSEGTLATDQTLDDSATSGAVLSLSAGSVVSFGGRSSDTVRTGALVAGHLPPIPAPVPGALITTRGIFISPSDFVVQPGGALSIPNDLGLAPGATAPMYMLDPVSGVWNLLPDGTVDGTGTLIDSAATAVTGGGLYCFAITVGTLTTVTGRVVDRSGAPLYSVLVRGGNATAETASDGRFTLADLGSVDGQGVAVPIDIEFHGNRYLRPNGTTVQQTFASGTVDIGDVSLDSGYTSEFRGMLINRGLIFPRLAVAMNSVDGLSVETGISDTADARFCLPDLDAGSLSFVDSQLVPNNQTQVYALEGLPFLGNLQRSLDLQLFYDEQDWLPGAGGGTSTWILDGRGTGLVTGAALVQDRGSGDLYFGTTENNVIFRIAYGPNGQATASISTSSDGRSAVSAFSAGSPVYGRIELPLVRADREQLGEFAPYGVVAGTLPTTGDPEKDVRVTSTINLEQWFDAVFFGVSIDPETPRFVDPAVTGGNAFEVGVPVPEGNVVGVYGSTAGGVFTLENIVWDATILPVAAASIPVDFGSVAPADTTFALPGVVAGRDSALLPTDFAFDYGLVLPDTTLLDVARGVAGNLMISGDDASFLLPALSGQLAGAQHQVSLFGTTVVSGATVEQRSYLPISASSVPQTTLLPLPVVTSPAPGATVSASGFQVQFTSPPDALYTQLILRTESGTEVREWGVVLPATDTSYDFRILPDPAPTPLAPGTWRLTVASTRVDSGALATLNVPYDRAIARWLSLSAFEKGAAAVSSVSFDLVLN